MTAAQYVAAREAYKKNGRNPDAAKAQQSYRTKYKKDMIQKIVSDGEPRLQKYMTIEGTLWSKLGDSIVIAKDHEFITYLRYSQGGAATGWDGGHK